MPGNEISLAAEVKKTAASSGEQCKIRGELAQGNVGRGKKISIFAGGRRAVRVGS